MLCSNVQQVSSALTFNRYAPSEKIEKTNNLKMLGSKSTKGNKQDSQNQPKALMPERGEP